MLWLVKKLSSLSMTVRFIVPPLYKKPTLIKILGERLQVRLTIVLSNNDLKMKVKEIGL